MTFNLGVNSLREEKMSDVIERAEAELSRWADTGAGDTRTAYLVSELVGEFQASRLLLEETQRQLSDYIRDFCALRDALPRDRVQQILLDR